ncbi:hypothetical protein Y032_0182g902 [Ancylostoma ceylanicum]|uniref:Uncharacterized protein n=1 Tax=Ancylostoma ceylanicum TaxID=53326 RepID=A0A016SSD4_9BILA|nr:hypothetical protein Y032_0182g902 [Ancylostoma ceylanicum]
MGQHCINTMTLSTVRSYRSSSCGSYQCARNSYINGGSDNDNDDNNYSSGNDNDDNNYSSGNHFDNSGNNFDSLGNNFVSPGNNFDSNYDHSLN